jgi:hypothetical protein
MSTRFATTGPEGPQLGVNDAANLRTQFAALRADLIKALSGDYLVESAALAIGSTTTAVANGAFTFVITPGNDVIPQGTYGAVALDIGADGTIDVIEAGDNATGYASAALAIAGIAAAAADHVRMGTVTATKSDGAFTFGTTALDAANTTVAYTSTPIFGLDASLTSSDLTGA